MQATTRRRAPREKQGACFLCVSGRKGRRPQRVGLPILGVEQKSGGRDLHRSSPSETERVVSRAAGYRSHTKQRRASDGRIEDGAPIGAEIRSAVAGVAGGSSLRTSRHSLYDGAVRGAGVRWRSEQFAVASALWPAGIVRRGSGRVARRANRRHRPRSGHRSGHGERAQGPSRRTDPGTRAGERCRTGQGTGRADRDWVRGAGTWRAARAADASGTARRS